MRNNETELDLLQSAVQLIENTLLPKLTDKQGIIDVTNFVNEINHYLFMQKVDDYLK